MGTKVLIMLAIILAIGLAARWFGRTTETAMRNHDVVVSYLKARPMLVLAAHSPRDDDDPPPRPGGVPMRCGPAETAGPSRR